MRWFSFENIKQMYKDLYVRESQFISLSVIYLVMKKLGSLNNNPFRSILIIDIVKCRALGRPFLLVVIIFFFSNFHLDAIFGKEYLNFCTSLRLIKGIFPTDQTSLFSVECRESRIRNLLMIDDSRKQKHLVLYQIGEVLNASRLGLRQDRT